MHSMYTRVRPFLLTFLVLYAHTHDSWQDTKHTYFPDVDPVIEEIPYSHSVR